MGTVAQAESALRESQTGQELSRLKGVEEHLAEIVAELESRLEAVLRVEPEGGAKDGTPMVALIPLAETIRSVSIGIDKSIGRLQRIVERIEL